MPYLIRREGSRYCVYTEGADGQPEGDAHGCHASREEAIAQQRALYANAPDKGIAGVETKHVTVPAELKADGEEGSIKAVFSTFDVVDRGGDVVTAKAFTDGQPVPMVWAHQWDKPIGKGVVRVHRDRAEFHGKFFLDTTMGMDAYRTVKAMGDLQEFSWGFRITDHKYGQKDGEEVRFINGAEVFEVSPVLVGEGLGTGTLAIKRADPEVEPEVKVGRRFSRETEAQIRAAAAGLLALLGDGQEAEADDEESAETDDGKSAEEPLVAAGERLSGELASFAARVSAAADADLRKDRDALSGFARRLSAHHGEVVRSLDRAAKAADVDPQELRAQYQRLVAQLGLPR